MNSIKNCLTRIKSRFLHLRAHYFANAYMFYTRMQMIGDVVYACVSLYIKNKVYKINPGNENCRPLPKEAPGKAVSGSSSYKKSTPDNRERISIILPVYNAFDDLQLCIERLICHTDNNYRLIIIDDASPDERIRPMLRAYAQEYDFIEIVYNEINSGYTKSINKGCRIADPEDVVLLNSDTCVTSQWLEKMVQCYKKNPGTATVTPLSNAAGAFSIPVRNKANKIPKLLSADDISSLVDRLSIRLSPQVPTGNGYCMYVSREALNEVGYFDETNFSSGYGEENDFCMRANKKGFIHVIDDATFIYHKRSASYKKRKKKILSKNMRKLAHLHPEYPLMISRWLASDPLDELRFRLLDEMNRLMTEKCKP